MIMILNLRLSSFWKKGGQFSKVREKRLSSLPLVAGWSRRWPEKAANQDKPKTGRGNPCGHQLNLSKQAEHTEILADINQHKTQMFSL